MSSWKEQAERIKQAAAKPPKGYMTLEQIAAEMDCSEAKAKENVQQLMREGVAERLVGRKLTQMGQVVSCVYYRLTSPSKTAKAAKDSKASKSVSG